METLRHLFTNIFYYFYNIFVLRTSIYIQECVCFIIFALRCFKFHLHCAGNLVERNICIEDVLDLGEKFNDVLFVSRNNANLVERSTVNTNDILVLGEKINDRLKVSE